MQLKETKEHLNNFGKFVVQQARSRLSKGKKNVNKKLYQSLDYIPYVKDDVVGVRFIMEDYGKFVDQGVKGAKSTSPESRTSRFRYTNKMPPSKVFDKWSSRSGIAPRDKKGRFIKRKSLNFLIARSIYKKGIRATMFFTKPFEEALPLFEDEILEGVLEDNLNLEE